MRLVLPCAVLAVALSCLAPARADNLDAGLLANAPEVLKYLRAHQCTNVGVLKFRVQKGTQAVSLKTGPLNSNLPLRLENALIAKNDQSNPIGVIHDADHVAAERKLPNYAKADGRRRLFDEKFPLAWGQQQVKPHTFLTGLVRVTPDMRRATVTIEAFDRDASQPVKVTSFDVAVDTSLLTDLGQSFQVSSRKMKLKRSFEEVEEAASEDAAERDKTQQAPNAPTSPATPSTEKLIDLEITYDGQKQEITSDPNSGGELRVAEPREGQKVKIAFRNVSTETLGVVVMINGASSNRMEQDDPVRCKKWLPGPGEQYVLEGFQVDEKLVRPFRILSDADSQALAYSDNLGLISVFVFRSGKGLNITPPIGGDGKPTINSEVKISRTANLRPTAAGSRAAHPASFKELQTTVRARAGTGPRTRGAIGHEDAAVESGPVTQYAFENPVIVMSMIVRYYKPKQ